MNAEEMDRIQAEKALILEIDVLRGALHKIATASGDSWAVEVATEALLKGDAIFIEDCERRANKEGAN